MRKWILSLCSLFISGVMTFGAPAPAPRSLKPKAPFTVKEVSGYYTATYGGVKFRFYLAEDGHFSSWWQSEYVPNWLGTWRLKGNVVEVREGEASSEERLFQWKIVLVKQKGAVVRSGYECQPLGEK